MKPAQERLWVAREAARILSEEGPRDHLAAKRKAASRLGLAARHLPTNREVEAALAEHQRLFEAAAQAPRLARLRRSALAIMDVLSEFEIRAAGAAAGETATAHAALELHVFVDPPEIFAFRVADLGLDYRESERRLRWGDGRIRAIPVFILSLNGQAVELLIFGVNGLREAPTDPATGRPMRRLARRALEDLLALAE
jgi:hypothetical protein